MRKLFNDPPSRTKTFKAGYGTSEKARKTIRRLKRKPCAYRRRVAGTMYARAKYHAHPTEGMKQSMKIYKQYLNTMKC
jgi:hypothetical protein